jgi:inorganic pyrophosphatase/exopolyphosphatase
VIERLFKEFPSSIDAELAHFLKAPIVLDSYNFEPTLKESKWTDKDLAVYKRLDEISSGLEDGRIQFERLFNAITDVAMNLKLGFPSLLIKDFKTYYLLNQGQTGIGLGTIHVPLRVMVDTFGFGQMRLDMSELINKRKLAYYGILTNCRYASTGEYRKEVLLYHQQPQSSD